MKSKKQLPTLNPYTITWATITPKFGKITKRDAKIISKVFCSVNYAIGDNELDLHAPTKRIMKDRLAKVSELGLFKIYTAFLYTDKQFSKRKFGKSFFDILTTKQKNSPIEVYK